MASITPLITLNYQAFEEAPIATKPSPHIVVPHFLNSENLKKILPALPTISKGGSYPPGALSLSAPMKALIAEMESPKLREAISKKFSIDVANAPSMLTLRGYSREKDGQIHTDSLSKKVTILLFLNEDSPKWDSHHGCLRFLNSPDNLDDYSAEIRPVNGTLVVFPNSSTSWHGYHTYVGPRFSIQLNYMHRDSKAQSELFRHKLSAFTKKISLLTH
ncbi:2OG-Fe(II) oxygenase [Entomobacter blattae]|uniref:Prolyl 4-hydroxylase alpha subunit domain-containing protein n=1 Tax=Entomobacter blattae TaxID=2762277 RepID=A0A7H1NPH1_9PROT|nr:2OG-Fe(II) oxygenase [Entomobacter blattae]QNT77681.1 hypothetical protein JGUZn3_04310 [Entomobacter blattae]